MGTARFVFGVLGVGVGTVGVVAGTRIGLSKWVLGTNNQTGVISNIGEKGWFVKTNEMTVQRAKIASGNPNSEMEFSLYQNQELIGKAKKFSEEGTFVSINYKKYCTAPWFAAGSSRKVLNIEPVKKDANASKGLRKS